MTQLTFNLEPSPVVPVDPNVEPEAKPRLSRQAYAILARLQEGPATNLELCQIAQRFGARLHDLRKAGYAIESEKVDATTGVYEYRVVERRSIA